MCFHAKDKVLTYPETMMSNTTTLYLAIVLFSMWVTLLAHVITHCRVSFRVSTYKMEIIEHHFR
jgi:hypothetical protein